MKRGIRRPPIRVRLALWSTAGLLIVLVVVGAAMTVGLRSGLRDRAHQTLEVPFRVVEHQLSAHPELTLHELLHTASPGQERPDEVIGQVLDAHGNVIDSTGQSAVSMAVVGPSQLAAAERDGEWHEPRHLAGRSTDDMVVVVPLTSGPQAGNFVVLAQSLATIDTAVWRLVRLLLILCSGVLVASFVGGSWIARATLRPVDALTHQARTIDPELSDTTLPVPAGDDEISRLALALNDMLIRLRREIERERRFSADASHELRNPLALMTTSLDVFLRSDTTPQDARPILESVREDVSGLNRVIEDLLVLSRADAAGRVELATTQVDLLDLAVSVAASFRGAATVKGIVIEVSGTPAIVHADAPLLTHALANLVDNALKFSRRGDNIDLIVADDLHPHVTVADTGVGIPTDDLTHIFDRFYQIDQARRTGGSGLGLAIVSSIVRAHQGTVDVQSTLNEGTRFTISIPPARSTGSTA